MPDVSEGLNVQQEPQKQGIYNISDIDKLTMQTLEQSKTAFMLELSNYSFAEALARLSDFATTFKQFLEKYFTIDEIKKFTINFAEPSTTGNQQWQALTFYDYKRIIDDFRCFNRESVLRQVAEDIFIIYNHFVKRLGQAIPTQHINVKKK